MTRTSLHHLAIDIGEPEIAAGVAVGQLGVVDAQLIEKGGVQIVNGDAVLRRL